MTSDLTQLAKILREDTSEKRLVQVIENKQAEILRAIEEDGEFVLDKELGITISAE